VGPSANRITACLCYVQAVQLIKCFTLRRTTVIIFAMSVAMHILVTCTKAKHFEPLRSLVMRQIKEVSPAARARAWIKRIVRSHGRGVAATDLYAGDHWLISNQLPVESARNGFKPTLWVISAGYGLISASAKVQPYSAAFSPRHPDCVTSDLDPSSDTAGFQAWWQTISKWRGPVAGAPRSFAELVRRNRRAKFVVIASELYLQAVWHDVLEGAEALGKHFAEQLLIISAGTSDFGCLSKCALAIDARLQSQLSGARRSLNVRAARRVLLTFRPSDRFSKIRTEYAALLAASKPVVSIHRERARDEEVLVFIKKSLSKSATASASRLLQKFRVGGRACEQKRFGRLYLIATETPRAKSH